MKKLSTHNTTPEQLQLIAQHQDEPVTEELLTQLGMSRSTYFRRLAEIREKAARPLEVEVATQLISPTAALALLVKERLEVRAQLIAFGATAELD